MAQNETILITGGNGLIGSKLIERLSGKYTLVSLDKNGNNYPPEAAEIVCMDITKDESISKALKRVKYAYGNKISSVVHLAAYYDFSGKPSNLYKEVTVKGTEQLLKHLRDFEVEQFIFSSSMLVYKPTIPGNRIDEDWPLQPKWDYPQSKVDSEKIILNNRKNMKAVLMRISGIYGDKTNSIPIANQIQRIFENQLTARFFPGDKTHGSTFLHIDDLIEAIVSAIERRKNLPDEYIVNIGEPNTLSYDRIQNIISQNLFNKPWETRYIPPLLAKTGAWIQDIFGSPFIKPWMIDMADDHFELDIRSARKHLDWYPQNSLKEALPEMIDFLRETPEQWYKVNKLKAPSDLQDLLDNLAPKKKEKKILKVVKEEEPIEV